CRAGGGGLDAQVGVEVVEVAVDARHGAGEVNFDGAIDLVELAAKEERFPFEFTGPETDALNLVLGFLEAPDGGVEGLLLEYGAAFARLHLRAGEVDLGLRDFVGPDAHLALPVAELLGL